MSVAYVFYVSSMDRPCVRNKDWLIDWLIDKRMTSLFSYSITKLFIYYKTTLMASRAIQLLYDRVNYNADIG